MADHITVRLPDDVRLHVAVSGAEDATTTLALLHGWTLDHRTWHRQIDALTARRPGLRIVAYDARGHGRSGATPRRAATLQRLGDDLHEVLRQVAPEGPVVLAGHSMGGMSIMEYAHRHPGPFAHRVAGLVLVATTAEGHTHTAYGLPPRLAPLIRLAETTGAGVLARCGPWRPHRPLLRVLRPPLRWLLFGDHCDPADLALTTRALAHAPLCSIGGFRASIGTQHRLDTLATLGDIPAVVLVGDRDRLTPPPCAESIAAALPGATLTVCPGAGHMLPLERPEEVTAALLSVVDRVEATRSATRQPLPGAPATARAPSRAPAGSRPPSPESQFRSAAA